MCGYNDKMFTIPYDTDMTRQCTFSTLLSVYGQAQPTYSPDLDTTCFTMSAHTRPDFFICFLTSHLSYLTFFLFPSCWSGQEAHTGP
jgi:hypothetical protein